MPSNFLSPIFQIHEKRQKTNHHFIQAQNDPSFSKTFGTFTDLLQQRCRRVQVDGA